MATISGRVVLAESGAPIPDLLIVLFDLDPATKGEDPVVAVPALVAVPGVSASEGDRLGSVLTDANGAFSLDYDLADFQIRNPKEQRPDLQITVLAPEEPGRNEASRVLYSSTAVRQNAGRTEQYLIRLGTDLLTKAGIKPPSSISTDGEPAGNVSKRLVDAAVRQAGITDGAISAARARMDAHRARFEGFATTFKPSLLSAISTLPPSVQSSDQVVREGESPLGKAVALMKKNLRETINSSDPKVRAPRRGFISLTPAQVERLKGQLSAAGNVPDAALAAIAAENGAPAATTFVQALPRLPICRAPTDSLTCTQSVIDPPPPSDEPPPVVPGDGITPVTTSDIPKFLARLLNPITAPEEQLLTGLTPVATRESVEAKIKDLQFSPSPADVPAYHDFLNLQIAFEHVWQEAIDQGVLDVAENAYQTIVELGGDPTHPVHQPSGPVRALLGEGRATLLAYRGAVRDHRGDAGGEGGVTVTATPGGTPFASGSDSCASVGGSSVRDHRTGDVGVTTTAALDSEDPAERLPALLEDLQKRLQTRYAFTIYAANAQERSVNFGILNTFRQTWTPLSYQAGPLVKSIPLAPRQSQKLVISRKTTRKATTKDAQTRMTDQKDESNVTDRAEQDIVNRASVKTNFSVDQSSGAGAAGVGATTSVKFGIDADKQTDDTKKSFHEAVFKSAQEVRQERTTEVTTESAVETERTETTEISNPNDEIACTFLFYELQRRYRVFERLYKVQPVVLVAQEVPQPQEINPAWLLAHDWILRRSIMDPSFLPALDSISQIAGDETAIAEMKINVDQQRCIVTQLRQELAIARQSLLAQEQLIDQATFARSGTSSVLGLVEKAVSDLPAVRAVDKLGDFLFGSNDASQNENARQSMQDRVNAAADNVRDLSYRLDREVTALNALLETYTKALRNHHTHLTDIAKLQNHVKDNILHYMQAKWREEPPDQRFFRLHNTPVPQLAAASREHRIRFDAPLPVSAHSPHLALPRFGGVQVQTFPYEGVTQVADPITYAPLYRVADLDTLLGFKGNLMIFPLNASNALTDFMMDPYVDRATGALIDPSDPINWSLDEFTDYVCCLEHELAPAELEVLRPTLQQLFQIILSNPARNDDVLVVPTHSLFIETLPDSSSNLEEFKRAHRMEDVKKAQSETRAAELRNVLRAMRILSGELEDPVVDRKVLIQGSVPSVVVNPPES